MLDPKMFALLFATMEVIIKNNPEIRGDIFQRAVFFEDMFFVPHASAHESMREAFDYIKNKQEE